MDISSDTIGPAKTQNGKVRVYNHVNYMGRQRLNGVDYTETFLGGLVLNDNLFRLGTNGSISEVILIPS